MNIVDGISHPKQVFIFKNLISELKKKGHDILIIVVEKEICCRLLKEFSVDFIRIGTNQKKIPNKLAAILPFTIKTLIKRIKINFLATLLPLC